MRIANPIYDVVFKYLMQNNEIAILILSTILEEEIIALDFLPQETATTVKSRSPAGENLSFTVYRLDFSARIRMPEGEEKHVVIEIQKAKFAADIMRFRRYLGEQYRRGFPIPGSKVAKGLPIISIYFLGYRLDHIDVPVIKILRHYYDAATGEEIPTREKFIESLTHDSFVIQIPQLGPERRTAAEKLLAIFDQHRKLDSDNRILDVDEDAYPEEYRKVVRWLNEAVSDPEIKRIMETEDEILAEFEDIERRIMGMEKSIEEKDRALEENAKALDERDRALEENAKALDERDRALEENAKALEEKDRLIAELRRSR
uniref:PD-(D/E)XK nuclease family transposase n=1 Tax=Candidatus Kentrum sp. FW TaxID=2126338 RepID=A0A450RT78_9GAMM|nr:MAG: hypothetical protein BECKFW1821A_GA0114235_100174 [Candidatus Kentron sp. FW]